MTWHDDSDDDADARGLRLRRGHGRQLWLMMLRAGAGARRADPRVRQCALAGGDDYELCFTAPLDRRAEVLLIASRLRLPLTEIGRIEAGTGIEVRDVHGAPIALAQRGFDHFG